MLLDSPNSTLAFGAMALLFATSIWASVPGHTIRFSGPILSSTTEIPSNLSVFADCADGRPRILGAAPLRKYRITLPADVVCIVHVGNWNWDARPLTVVGAVDSYDRPVLVYPRAVPEPAIAQELLKLREQDQADRAAMTSGRKPGVTARVRANDNKRQKRLAEIIRSKGWPTPSSVGWQASDAAWLIAQHADNNLGFQKQVLALLKLDAAKYGLPMDVNMAYLSDRISVAEHRPQLYGTQMTNSPPFGQCDINFLPLDNRQRVDERRQAIGLMPLKAYLNLYLVHNNCPPRVEVR